VNQDPGNADRELWKMIVALFGGALVSFLSGIVVAFLLWFVAGPGLFNSHPSEAQEFFGSLAAPVGVAIFVLGSATTFGVVVYVQRQDAKKPVSERRLG
jgi:hypothetical protein